MQNKTSKWRTLLKWLPGVLISLLAIYAVLKFIKPDDFVTAFKTVNIRFILLIFVMGILGLLARGRTWQVILGKNVSFKQSFFGICEGYFLNNVLPFRAGEIGRSYFVGRSSGLGTFYVLSTIVIERSFDVLFAAALVVVTLPFLIGMEWIKPVATFALIIVVGGLFLLFLIARNKEKVISLVEKIKKPKKIVDFLLPKIESIIEGFSLLANPIHFIRSFLWVAICWTIWVSTYYIAVAAIIPNAPWWWAAFVTGVLALGVAIPSAPSALGVFEASFVGAMAILGAESSTALAYAIILHINQFITNGVFGIWGLFREGLKFSQMFSPISAVNSETGKEETIKENE